MFCACRVLDVSGDGLDCTLRARLRCELRSKGTVKVRGMGEGPGWE